MRKILSLIKKELIQIRRDRRQMIIIIIAPIIQIMVLGYAINLDVKNIPTAIYDGDNSLTSRRFIQEIFNTGYFKETGRLNSIQEVDKFLDQRKAEVVLVFPPDFERSILSGKQGVFFVAIDGTESQTAIEGINYIEMISQQFGSKVMLKMSEKLGLIWRPVTIEPEARVFYNPELSSRNFFLPGIFGLLLMQMTIILTSMAIVKEKDQGTMEQLIVTPLKPLQIILGKLLPFFIIGTADLLLILLLTRFWFNLPLRGSFLLLLGLSFIYMLSTLGIGLFVSTITRTPQQAMLTSFFFMIPMILLSGFVFPIENMPRLFQWLTVVIPLRYYLVILRGIFLKGVGFSSLYEETLALVILAVVINLLSIVRFHRRLD
ncbi:MAG: ABC transporter permease [Candidatus Aminicenantes bacterium]|jgi:ABC-2 type transport system permease protein|nr:ABC transporter permease [Candidatus Aminicenantes bacterium]